MRVPLVLVLALSTACASDPAQPSADASADAETGADGNDASGDAPADASADVSSDASDDVLSGDAGDADADASAPCGDLNQACCPNGPACADVTLSCVASKCQHVMVVTAAGSEYDLNGVPAPALTLKAGVAYTFDLTAVPSYHPWIFTNSSTGGLSATPLSVGVLPGYSGQTGCGTCSSSTFTITPNATPSSFYYMCQNHQLFGNQVTVSP